jgi:hypothetical protein
MTVPTFAAKQVIIWKNIFFHSFNYSQSRFAKLPFGASLINAFSSPSWLTQQKPSLSPFRILYPMLSFKLYGFPIQFSWNNSEYASFHVWSPLSRMSFSRWMCSGCTLPTLSHLKAFCVLLYHITYFLVFFLHRLCCILFDPNEIFGPFWFTSHTYRKLFNLCGR